MGTEPNAPGGLRRLSQRHARGEISSSGYREARRAYIDRVVAGQQGAEEDAPLPTEATPAAFLATQPVPALRHLVPRRRFQRRMAAPLALALALIVSVTLLVLAI